MTRALLSVLLITIQCGLIPAWMAFQPERTPGALVVVAFLVHSGFLAAQLLVLAPLGHP